MSYVALRFLVCMLSHPDQCQSVETPAGGPLTYCWVHGQEIIAAWLAQHTAYEWRGAYRCEPGQPA